MLSPQQNYVTMFLLVTLPLQYVHTSTSISLIEFSTPIKDVLAFLIVLYASFGDERSLYVPPFCLNFNFCSMAQSIDSGVLLYKSIHFLKG